MQIYSSYIDKQANSLEYISAEPHPYLQNIIVIPAYDEPDILQTLRSLYNCQKPEQPVEVIIVINSGETASASVLEQNGKTLAEVQNWAENHNTDF